MNANKSRSSLSCSNDWWRISHLDRKIKSKGARKIKIDSLLAIKAILTVCDDWIIQVNSRRESVVMARARRWWYETPISETGQPRHAFTIITECVSVCPFLLVSSNPFCTWIRYDEDVKKKKRYNFFLSIFFRPNYPSWNKKVDTFQNATSGIFSWNQFSMAPIVFKLFFNHFSFELSVK